MTTRTAPRSWLVAHLLLGGVLLGGCGGLVTSRFEEDDLDNATLDDSSDELVQNEGLASAPPNDPVYPYADDSPEHYFMRHCPSFPGVHGAQSWCSNEKTGETSEVCGDPNMWNCLIPCVDESSCPLPETGTAKPVCFSEAETVDPNCLLACDESVECPSGMACVQFPEQTLRVCMWPER